MVPSDSTDIARTKAKISAEIQEMVDELETQARIFRSEGEKGLERHRRDWFQKGYEHGLKIKQKYGITGNDAGTIYKQCCAIVSDEKERTRIPEISMEDNTVILRSRAGTYCPSLEAVKRVTGSYILGKERPELCHFC